MLNSFTTTRHSPLIFISTILPLLVLGWSAAALAQLEIDDSLVSTNGLNIETEGIFAVWWDPAAGNLEPGPDVVFGLLDEVQNDVTNNLGFGNPPNPGAGYYFNVFLHRGEDDRFPNFFGNGVGFDSPTELPYLAMPVGAHDDRSNVLHEGFHVFQTSSNYEVVDTDPDAVWIVEGSAEWYQASRNPTDRRSFVVAGSPYALPHLPLWYTPGNEPVGVNPDNGWLYGVREYGMSVMLYFLTNVASVDPAVISGVYTTNSDLTAQQYIFDAVGGDNFRNMFADWAVQTAVGFDYLSEEQIEFTLEELNFFASSEEIKNNILELDSANANGSYRPDQELTPAGWAYNSIKINNNDDVTYSIDIRGDTTGSEGALSHFEARAAVVNGDSITYHNANMFDDLSGRLVFNATASDEEIYLVIASVPDQLSGIQTYDYVIDIDTSGMLNNGDFDNNGVYECADVDSLVEAIATGNQEGRFDLSGDGIVDQTDLDLWLVEAGAATLNSMGAFLPGDGNLDGIVDISDFNTWNGNKFTSTASWCSGDFNADGSVDISDFNVWNANKFQSSDQSQTVPEPNVHWFFVGGLLLTFNAIRRQRQCACCKSEFVLTGEVDNRDSRYPRVAS
ncbi:MAG: hypothetical protein AAF497_01815 [Planctomycetota bacterium]